MHCRPIFYLDQETINQHLETIFGIKTGYHSSIISSFAKVCITLLSCGVTVDGRSDYGRLRTLYIYMSWHANGASSFHLAQLGNSD